MMFKKVCGEIFERISSGEIDPNAGHAGIKLGSLAEQSIRGDDISLRGGLRDKKQRKTCCRAE